MPNHNIQAPIIEAPGNIKDMNMILNFKDLVVDIGGKDIVIPKPSVNAYLMH